jgi:thiaminase
MIDFVSWLRYTVDTTPVSLADQVRLQGIFRDVLRYEFLFWEMAYRNERWPEG